MFKWRTEAEKMDYHRQTSSIHPKHWLHYHWKAHYSNQLIATGTEDSRIHMGNKRRTKLFGKERSAPSIPPYWINTATSEWLPCNSISPPVSWHSALQTIPCGKGNASGNNITSQIEIWSSESHRWSLQKICNEIFLKCLNRLDM